MRGGDGAVDKTRLWCERPTVTHPLCPGATKPLVAVYV